MRRTDRPAERGRIAQVLVVDDEPDIRELLELTLVRMGLDVLAVSSIGEAKEQLKEGRYDLCLTDMRLPDGEGLELVRHISGLRADLPVAVITAYGSAENAVAALKAGAFDYVSKPVGLEQLADIGLVVDHQHLVVARPPAAFDAPHAVGTRLMAWRCAPRPGNAPPSSRARTRGSHGWRRTARAPDTDPGRSPCCRW